jgi:hypothetical protein
MRFVSPCSPGRATLGVGSRSGETSFVTHLQNNSLDSHNHLREDFLRKIIKEWPFGDQQPFEIEEPFFVICI